MEGVVQVVTSVGPLAAAAGLGWFLRQSVCTETDGNTAAKFALWVTLPSLALQSFNRVSLPQVPLAAFGVYTAVTALSGAIAWAAYRGRHPKERGLLAGASLGGALAFTSLPLAAALFGVAGARAAVLCAAVNAVATWVASYLLFASAGPAFPDSYQHLDGGAYRGEWKGMLKEGPGVYTYASGARYEGEWLAGVKEGRGVYHFPKGGVYEGEWRDGKMAGLGVRTFASGRVQAGLWEDGRLATPREEWQCVLAVQGANEAAEVARRVQVGGGSVTEAARRLAAQPSTWAYVAAAAVVALQQPLTPALDTATRALAAAHGPLALIAAGMLLDVQPVEPRQLKEVAEVLAMRLLPPLVTAAAAAAVLTHLGWAVQPAMALLGPVTVCALAPVATTALTFAHEFRLNENLAAGLTRAATAVSVPLMAVVGAAAALASAQGNVQLFIAATSTAAGVVALGAALARLPPLPPQAQFQARSQRVPMVYAGPVQVAASEGFGADPTPATETQQHDGLPNGEGSRAHQDAAPLSSSGEGAATKPSPFTDVEGPQGGPSPSAAQALGVACPVQGLRLLHCRRSMFVGPRHRLLAPARTMADAASLMMVSGRVGLL